MSKKKKEVSLDPSSIHGEFQKCDSIHKTTLGDPEINQLPLYFGYKKAEKEFILQIGDEVDAIFMDHTEFAYFMASIAKLSSEVMKESIGKNIDKFIKDEILKNGEKLSYGNSSPSSDEETDSNTPIDKEKITPEELEKYLDTMAKKSKADSKEEDIDASEYEEIKEQLADFEKIYKDLSEEEKTKLEKQMALKREQLLDEKTKKFEATLLGEIEEEEKIEYNYKYFKSIYDEKGPEFMREELAKIPKAERSAMIKKIVAEVEQEQINKIK